MYANRTQQTQKSGKTECEVKRDGREEDPECSVYVMATENVRCAKSKQELWQGEPEGVSTSQSRRKPLQDNSWIKFKDNEEEQGVDDLNYGRDVLGKTTTNTDSKPANIKQSITSVSSSTKRVSVAPDVPKKPLTSTATKPPVPEKKTTSTTQSNSFTARVFSGANSSEKVVSPVKKSMDEKLPVLEPRKDALDGTEKKREIPVPPPITTANVSVRTEKKPEIPVPPPITTATVSVRTEKKPEIPVPPPTTTTSVSVRKTSETITSPEKSYTSFTSKTEPYSRTLELSPPKSNWDYNTSQQLNTMTTVKTLHSPINTTPSSAPSRIVGKRDLCSFCAKSIIETERIILDDLQIFSHTFCFKCDTCYHALGNLAAGDSLWVHRGRVTCERCYNKTKDQWYR